MNALLLPCVLNGSKNNNANNVVDSGLPRASSLPHPDWLSASDPPSAALAQPLIAGSRGPPSLIC